MSDKLDSALLAKLAVCGTGTVFFGNAFYTSCVAIPASLKLVSNKAKLQNWSDNFELSKKFQGSTAILTALGGLALYHFNDVSKEFAWGGICFSVLTPYTFAVMLPRIRHCQYLMKKAVDTPGLEGSDDFRQATFNAITAWANAHLFRTVLSGVGLMLLLRGLARGQH